MAKDEIDRAARAGADDVAGASKQQEAAALLKKMKVEAAEKAAADTDHQETAEASEATAEEQVAAASAEGTATESGDVYVPGVADSYAASEASGGLSTATLLTIGGVALVAGGIAIAASDDDDDGGKAKEVASVTPDVASAAEGDTVTFTVVGTPGQSFNFSITGTGVTPSDYQVLNQAGNTLTIGQDGTAVVQVFLTEDNVGEGTETLTLTVGGVAGSVDVVDPVIPPGSTFILTPGVDNVVVPAGDQVDTVKGVVDPVGAGGGDFVDDTTFSVGDVIQGNGNTIVQLVVDSAGTADFVTMSDIDSVEIISGAPGLVLFNAVSWDNIGDLTVVNGVGGVFAGATNLETGVDLYVDPSINGGGVIASYTDGLVVGVINTGKGGASVVSDGGAPDLTVNVANSQSGAMLVGAVTTFGLTGTGDMTVGNMTGVAGNNAFVGAGNPTQISGDMTFGNVDLTMGTSSLAVASFSATGDIVGGGISIVGETNSFASVTVAASGDVTLGDISVSLGDNTSATGFSTMASVGAFASGDVTVGDVSMSMGDYGATTGTGYLLFSAGAGFGTAGGNLAVGDVTMTGGDNVYASLWLHNVGTQSGTDITVGNISMNVGDLLTNGTGSPGTGYNAVSAYLRNTNALAGGDLTVGNVDMAVGLSGYMIFSAELQGIGGATQTGDLGSLTVGDLAMSVDQNGSGSIYVSQQQTASTAAQLGMGALTVGNVDLSLGQDAQFTVTITQDLSGTSGGAMGDLTVGNLTADLGIGASLYYYVFATNSAGTTAGTGAAADLGNISVGDVNVVGDDGVTVSVSRYFSATSGGIPSVDFGGVSLQVGVSGSAFDNGYAYARGTGAGIDSVTIGDLSYNIGQFGNGTAEYSISASSGDIGTVSIGNISMVVDESASFSDFNIYIYGANIGDVAIGNISATAGANGYFDFDNSIDISASNGNIGSVTVGDMSLTLGESASASDFLAFSIDAVGGDIGSVTFGNLNVDLATNAAWTSYDYVQISADGDIGSVTFGDTIVEMDAGAYISNSLERSISATHDVNSVSFGDISIAGHGQTFGLTMNLYVTAGNDIGSVSLGDISLVVDESSTAAIGLNVNLNAAAAIGGVDVGNVQMAYTVSSTAAAPFFSLYQTAATDGDVHIGGLTLTASSATANLFGFIVAGSTAADALTSTVTIDLVDVNVSATATGLFDLTGILAGVNSTQTIELGTIDYSGYGLTGASTTGVTIDVSGYAGAGGIAGTDADMVIIGSGLDDVIRANTSDTITMTGGDGADIFDFLGGNGLTTEAGADTVTDFEHNVDLLQIDMSVAVSAARYAEGTYASFAAFLADAQTRAADVDYDLVTAGQVGSSVFVAIDTDHVGGVDFVIELQNATIGTLDFGDYNFI